MDDPTTPLAGLAPDETPTIHRVAATPAPRGFAPGAVIAQRYRIVALLGRGGMGEVYRADDLRLNQPVALKFLTSGDAQAIESVYHEVRIAREVTHPNVCRVHDVVEADGLRFIAMEYVDGEDLASLLRRIGRLPAAKATEVAREMAAGLAAAHERGIIHRDLKPGNVMIDGRGRAHITDFGLAAIAGLDDKKIAGTPAYMAPEQVVGAQLSARTDVYALGLVLYEIFTGERVYENGSFADRRRDPVRAPRSLSSIVKDIDPAVDRLIQKCLESDPELRPASARAVLAMLPGGDPLDAALAAGETPSPEMVAAAGESGELSMRVIVPVIAAIVVLLGCVLVESGFYLFNFARKPPEVLADRAEDVIARAGEATQARDTSYRFDPDLELVRSKWGDVPPPAIAPLRPGVLRFIYRRTPSQLIAQRIGDTVSSTFIFRSGTITIDDPPIAAGGDAAVVLDQSGALVEYRARPSAGATPVDWNRLLESTGVDMKSVRVATPEATPPVSSDGRVAFTALYPGRGESMHIEGASLNGKATWLRVYAPWHRRDARQLMNTIMAPAAMFCMSVVVLIAGVILAVRNLRRGRSDRRGALRLALYVGGFLYLSWLIAAHHVLDGYGEARMLSQGMSEAAGSGLMLWLCYVALEPEVRRRWPRALIGWTRLLAGRFRDPMVGRQILIGILAGTVGAQILWFGRYAPEWFGAKHHHYVHADSLDPLRVFIGNQLMEHVESIEIAIGALLVYLVLMLVARKPAVAFALWFLLFFAVAAANLPIGLYMALLLYVITRQGLLAGAATGATIALLFESPITFDTSAWFFARSTFVLMLVTLAAVWAAYTALGTRRNEASLAIV